MQGIEFYTTPNWSKLGELEVWTDAAGQILFSLGAGIAALPTLASFNNFHKVSGCLLCEHFKICDLCFQCTNNLFFASEHDVFFICIANCLTSFVAGFVIFGTLGFLANLLEVEVDDLATARAGMAFITYPDLV